MSYLCIDKFQENEFNYKVSANFELKIIGIFLVKSIKISKMIKR